MKKKIYFKLGIALSLAAIISTSCQPKATQSNSSTTTTPQTEKTSTEDTATKEKPDEVVTIRMINRVNADVIIDNNPLYDAIEDTIGIRVEVEAPPIANYQDRLQIVMASGDLPDLIYNWGFDKNYEKWAADGLLLPLDDLVKDQPNLEHNITPEMYDTTRVSSTGKIYAVPRTNKINRWGMIINKSWLDKFGMEIPRTIDELYEFGKKVANEDPDGNGQKDTYLNSPVVSETDGVFDDTGIVEMFLPWPSFGAPDHDGEYKIREKMNGYYPYLEFLNKLYAEKIMDPEYFINKIYDDTVKSQQDRIAIARSNDSILVLSPEWSDNDKFEKFTFIPPMQTSTGKSYNYINPPVWGGFSISEDSKNVDAAIKFLDWGNSPEGFEMLNLGVKGVNYNNYDLATRTLDRTEEQTEQVKTILSSYTTIAFAYEGLAASVSADPNRVKVYNDQLARYLSQVEEISVPYVSPLEYDVFTASNPDLVKKKIEMENKFITGEITLDELKDFIDNQYLPKTAAYEAEYLDIMSKIK